MITFPKGFVPTHFEGYYWNTINFKLYSLKSGVLRNMRRRDFRNIPDKYYNKLSFNCSAFPFYYVISHKGKRKYLTIDTLSCLKETNFEIPVYEQ